MCSLRTWAALVLAVAIAPLGACESEPTGPSTASLVDSPQGNAGTGGATGGADADAGGQGGQGGEDADAAGAPDQGAPDVGAPDEGVPDEGTPDEGTPDEGAPDAVDPPDAGPDVDEPDVTEPDVVEPTGCLEGDPCSEAGIDGYCDAGGECAFECGDGILQAALGEWCDDGNTDSGDGCRWDCVTEEPIGAGWTGGQCEVDADCGPAGSVCIPGVGGGSCGIPCTQYCDDAPGAPVTFCIDADVYASRLGYLDPGLSLPPSLAPAMCVAKCDFALFPRTGCREGLHCEQRYRTGTSVLDEVCVPGPWDIGLAIEGGEVVGVDESAPEPAEPYLTLLESSCGFFYEPIPTALFFGLSTTLLAMGADGHGREWERVCEPTGDLPDVYGTWAQADAGLAFRLDGSRLEVVDWSAAAIYGSKSAREWLIGGPLYASRVMVYRDGNSYLYADAADDKPGYDPSRGRHFGMINGDEWTGVDTLIEPNYDYKCTKASGGGRFYRSWGRVDTVAYVADMAIDHLLTHGVMLGIGDLSLPTGGDIDDHGSHETGLDADLYLLTFWQTEDGEDDPLQKRVWVSECVSSGGWDCWYYENGTGVLEDFGVPGHVPAWEQLTTLAQYAYDVAGATHFVQHDVTVLDDFKALPGGPKYVDDANDEASGWPIHANHIHMRFTDW